MVATRRAQGDAGKDESGRALAAAADVALPADSGKTSGGSRKRAADQREQGLVGQLAKRHVSGGKPHSASAKATSQHTKGDGLPSSTMQQGTSGRSTRRCTVLPAASTDVTTSLEPVPTEANGAEDPAPHAAPDSGMTERERRMLARKTVAAGNQLMDEDEDEQERSTSEEDEEAEAEAEEQERRRSGRLRVTVLPAQPRPLRNRDAQRDRLPAAQDAEDEEDESSGDEDGQEDWGAMQRAKLRQRPDPSSKTAIIAHPSQPNRGRRAHSSRHQRRRSSRRYLSDSDSDDDLDPLQAWRNLQDSGQGPPLPGGPPSHGVGPPPTPQHLSGAGWQPAEGAVQWRQANPEITPVQVDASVTFGEVGGLEHYVQQLQEMVFLPLVYPELFQHFHVSPPRGVLFHGPPGTGKTLVARALAASASAAGRPVAFFMRKGADILSKWVGEAERQLRALFAEAQRCQPSIIFFDEIDGLAPARSSKQDQIHNSIVSTLLALMDGLDSRGQIVLIGATNRIDALDDALRRPGRFDRELLFPLPNLAARERIIDIHTRRWQQAPPPALRSELAALCVGYCGADLKALCTEATLHAVRRCYPQIYNSDHKLVIAPERVVAGKQDFLAAHADIVPAAHRQAATDARPLPELLKPCLEPQLQQLLQQLRDSFPAAAACLALSGDGAAADTSAAQPAATRITSLGCMAVQAPRLLICGAEGSGQQQLAAAVLHALEGLPVHALSLPALHADSSARSPEEALVHIIREAQRSAPCLLYLPHLQLWWDTASQTLRAALWMLLSDLPTGCHMAVVGTADCPVADLEQDALELFGLGSGMGSSGAFETVPADGEARAAMFAAVADAIALPPAPEPAPHVQASAPELPHESQAVDEAAAAQQAAAEAAQQKQLAADADTVRSLRLQLRHITTGFLGRKRYHHLFAVPPHPEEEPAFWQKDISMAHQLLDEVMRAVDAIPTQLKSHCEEIESRGGVDGQRAADLELAWTSATSGARSPPGKNARQQTGVLSRPSRHRGEGATEGTSLMHQDPEAIMRQKQAEKRRLQKLAQQQQQQQQEEEQQQQQQQEEQHQPADAANDCMPSEQTPAAADPTPASSAEHSTAPKHASEAARNGFIARLTGCTGASEDLPLPLPTTQEAEAIAAASAQHLANGTAEQLSSGPIVGLLPASQAAGLGTSNTSQGVWPEAVWTPNANGLSGTDGAHAADSPLESPATNPILHAGSTPFHAAGTAHGRPHATQSATRMGPSHAGTYQTPAAAPHQQAGVYTGPSSSVQLHTGGTSAGNTSYATPGSLLQTPLSAQPVGSPRMAANSVEGQYVRGLPYCTAASPSVQHGTTSLPNGLPEAAELASRATSRQGDVNRGAVTDAAPAASAATPADLQQAADLKRDIALQTHSLSLRQLQTLHSHLARVVQQHKMHQDREKAIQDAYSCLNAYSHDMVIEC